MCCSDSLDYCFIIIDFIVGGVDLFLNRQGKSHHPGIRSCGDGIKGHHPSPLLLEGHRYLFFLFINSVDIVVDFLVFVVCCCCFYCCQFFAVDGVVELVIVVVSGQQRSAAVVVLCGGTVNLKGFGERVKVKG